MRNDETNMPDAMPRKAARDFESERNDALSAKRGGARKAIPAHPAKVHPVSGSVR